MSKRNLRINLIALCTDLDRINVRSSLNPFRWPKQLYTFAMAGVTALVAIGLELQRMADEAVEPAGEWEYRRQGGQQTKGYQPERPAGEGWELAHFSESDNEVAYLWRRWIPFEPASIAAPDAAAKLIKDMAHAKALDSLKKEAETNPAAAEALAEVMKRRIGDSQLSPPAPTPASIEYSGEQG